MSDAILAAIDGILHVEGISYSARYCGERSRALGGDTRMDKWECLLARPANPCKTATFDFYTGLGLRSKPSNKPEKPHVADLLYSLILDSSACEQSFESWCADYGYDPDSRKAFATYKAGQRNTDKLRSLIKPATLQQLAELLQYY